MKKKIKKRGKIVAALITVISFAAALTWYNAKNAYAFGTYDAGGNKHFEEGHVTITINGPDGKSDSLTMYVHSDDYAKNKKVSGKDFKDKQHPYTISHYSGGYGAYSLQVDGQDNRVTIKSEKNSNNNYTLLTIPIKYYLPAHEQHCSQNYETVDKPAAINSAEDITFYCGGNDGFWDSSYHSDKGDWKYINIHISTALVGLSSTNNKMKQVNTNGKWKTYDWCSMNLNLGRTSGTLTFNGNGGSLNSYLKPLNDRDSYGTLPDGTREGYELAGYNKNQWGTADWVDEDTEFCSSCTIYAIWKPKTYSISYDAGDGDGDMSETSATYNKTVTLSQNKFTRKGYKFLGWSLKSDGASVDYQDGASFTYDKADDITLYAVWEKDNYEVKFHGNGSSAADYTRNLPYNKTTNLPANVFERPGYTFMGWAPEEELDRYKVIPKYTNGAEVKDLCEPGETCNLYAIWRKTDGSFETKNIIHDDKMFFGDVNITGGNGTEYDQGVYDSKAAKIDKENDPGYFTDRYKKED